MISSVKYNNVWYNDGRKHKNLSKGFEMAFFQRYSKHFFVNPYQLRTELRFKSPKASQTNPEYLGEMDKKTKSR